MNNQKQDQNSPEFREAVQENISGGQAKKRFNEGAVRNGTRSVAANRNVDRSAVKTAGKSNSLGTSIDGAAQSAPVAQAKPVTIKAVYRNTDYRRENTRTPNSAKPEKKVNDGKVGYPNNANSAGNSNPANNAGNTRNNRNDGNSSRRENADSREAFAGRRRESNRVSAAEVNVRAPRAVQPTELDAAGNEKHIRGKKKRPVKILFLGGVGEIGKNMTAIEYGNDIIVIDAGLTFPNNEDMPGIDLVVPDITYLVQNKDKVRGILLTHGHEDHIGGVPYLLKELNPGTPVYGTKLTLMLVDNKIQEHRIQNVTERVVEPGDKVKLGVFEVEFINVNHSISGAAALAIRTPNGLIYHSGDFKIDLTPVAGAPIDLERIAELGREGVLLYMGESTNIERPGYTMSETVVGTTLDHLFSENMNRRLIIATFASNVHRLQQIIDLAIKYRRKVALSGRSMFKVVDAAVKIGELKIPEGVLIDIEKSKNMFDGELLIVSTGTQGEPMSALTRMASGDFNKVTIGENDTIIISATPIPGNEKMVYRVINNLYKKGANVIYESLEKIHVSGHACQEEHKILHNLLNPKFFIPVHGEYRHLKRHALLAEELGMPARNILITEIGNCVELTDETIRLGENVPAGTRLIDGEGFEDYGTSEVMKDRLLMSAEGIFLISLAVTGNYVINDPIVESRGYVSAGNRDADSEMKSVVQKAVEQYDYENGNKEELALTAKKALKNYIFKKTKQSPLIVVSIMDV